MENNNLIEFHRPPNNQEDVEYKFDDGFAVSNIPHRFGYSGSDGWGYSGTGPTDFAANILFHFTGDKDFSDRWHIDFCLEVISHLPQNEGGTIKAERVNKWITARRTGQPLYPDRSPLPINDYAAELKREVFAERAAQKAFLKKQRGE